MRYIVVGALVLFTLLLGGVFVWEKNSSDVKTVVREVARVTSTQSPTPTLSPIPEAYTIPLRTHVIQTFNNCGPATLSMALSYLGINKSQAELGGILRPYQVAGGDNDDKSVTLSEVADQAETYGLHAYLRPNGTPEKLEQFIALGLVVVTRTWTDPSEDIGHYRVVRGYDRVAQRLIQDDSLQGKDIAYSYTDFNLIWEPFNYEYLVIVDDARRGQVEAILGEDLDESVAWERALVRNTEALSQDHTNWHLGFARSRIYYYLGDYGRSVEEFERVEDRLSFRTLWYQMEPVLSYQKLGSRERVFAITDDILNNQNKAYSEAYMVRGEMLEQEGDLAGARVEYELAIYYNSNMKRASEAFLRVSQ